MATVPPSIPRAASRARPRRRWRLAPWLALLLAALVAWFWKPVRETALFGTAYGARIGCACRYVAGRDIGQCRADFEPNMGFVMLSADDAAKSVTARFPLLASQTASYRPGEGCVLESWKD